MVIELLRKSFSNLLLPNVLKILFVCSLGYILGFVVLSSALIMGLGSLTELTGAPAWMMHIAGGVVSTTLAWFLFPLLYPVLVSFFIDGITEAVEREDYPLLPKANPPFWPSFWQDLRFSLKAVLLNILCLPIFIVPLVGQVFYFGLNGYLLGKQFFRMAAGRRVSLGEAESLMGRGRNLIFMLGIATMICATLPLIGLIAPVLGVAVMVHLFHHLHGSQQATVIPPR